MAMNTPAQRFRAMHRIGHPVVRIVGVCSDLPMRVWVKERWHPKFSTNRTNLERVKS